jgi:Zn-dependent protease with chaperone function
VVSSRDFPGRPLALLTRRQPPPPAPDPHRGLSLSGATLAEAGRLSGDGRLPEGFLARLKQRQYRRVLWLTTVSFYVSAAVLLVDVLDLAWITLDGMLLDPHVTFNPSSPYYDSRGGNLELVIFVVVMVSVIVFAVLYSVTLAIKDRPPGALLELGAQPRLAAVLARVAERVGAPPVDRVYLTPHTQVSVTARGGLGAMLRGRSERCLVLGAGALEALTLGELEALLAHELGHLAHPDTGAGALALGVRRALDAISEGLDAGYAATPANPAWIGFRIFQGAFLRASLGAAWLQETLADGAAARAFGSADLASGLRHLTTRSVTFEARVDRVVEEAARTHEPVPNLYAAARAVEIDEVKATLKIDARLIDAPPLDGHARLEARLAWLEALAAPAPRDADTGPAWSVFEDQVAVERWMTEEALADIAATRKVTLEGGDDEAPVDDDEVQEIVPPPA